MTIGDCWWQFVVVVAFLGKFFASLPIVALRDICEVFVF